MGRLKCKICGKFFNHLGSHIFHGHGMLAKEYKTEFELPYKMSLISSQVKKKKQIHFEEHRDKYIKNLLKFGKKYFFKKGQDGHRRISKYERKQFIERINLVNKNRKPENCLVCKMTFDNMDSHLYSGHRLLRIKK